MIGCVGHAVCPARAGFVLSRCSRATSLAVDRRQHTTVGKEEIHVLAVPRLTAVIDTSKFNPAQEKLLAVCNQFSCTGAVLLHQVGNGTYDELMLRPYQVCSTRYLIYLEVSVG